MAVEELRRDEMMAHLLNALDKHQDIGHYGRLVFAMVARYFMGEQELIGYLRRNPGFSEEEARALYLEVQSHDYNPPKRARVLEWQRRQDFPICPNPDDPDACNVYKNLRFPDNVYQHITEYYEQKAEEEEKAEEAGHAAHFAHRPSPKTGKAGGHRR